MSIFNKLGDMVKDAADKTSDAIEVQKINSKIGDEEKKIAKAKQQLGEYYWDQFSNGATLDEEAQEICSYIVKAESQKDKLQEEKDRIKTESADHAKMKSESADSTPCPSCGHAVPVGKKFCPNCGHNMVEEESEEEKASEEESQPVEELKCPSCGADIESGLKFCPECGQKLDQ